MIQEIKYNGYSANPSDYECQDGDLALSVGLVPEDGTLKPVLPPKPIYDLGEAKVELLHETANFKHYIVQNSGKYKNKITVDKGTGYIICSYRVYSDVSLSVVMRDGMTAVLHKVTISAGTCKAAFSVSANWVVQSVTLSTTEDAIFMYDMVVGTDLVTSETYEAHNASSISKISLRLEYFSEENTELKTIYSFASGVEIYKVDAIGNTLIVLTSTGMHYFLWKSASEGYLYLGTHLPELPISFGLQGEMIRTDEFSISFNSIGEGDIFNEFSDENKTKVTDQVLAKVNKFIADNSTNKGKFIYPFLVRYAYRLYDGSLTMHSAPILMVCSSDLAPQVFYTHITGKGSYTDAKLQVVGVLHQLDYAVQNEYQLNNLLNWKDIVRSVDIFISKPIYTYDQNGQCTKFVRVDDSDCYCICKHTNQAASTSTYPLRYQMHKFSKLYAFTFNPGDLSYPTGRLMIPQRSADTVKEDIRSCSQFYFLESIKIESLTTTRTVINVEEDYLQSLVNREVMTDDYDSHDTIVPRYSFAYNSRLNVANIKKQLFNGFNAAVLFPYTNGYVTNWSDGTPTMLDYTEGVTVYVFIKQDGQDIIVNGGGAAFGNLTPYLFLYYPNVNAYKAIVSIAYYIPDYYEIPLEQHDFLNGSFYFGGWDGIEEKGTKTSAPTVSTADEKTIDILNKIYTSEVNNPFYFPLLGINTVGTGSILGICAAAKALSQGQFGQFPLYAFSTEGVWALEVSSTGSYSARQPITRDVCINSDSITQIDSAVLFATDRGIMLISGSNLQCISDSLKSEDIFSITDLPGYDKLLSVFNGKADEAEQLATDDITMLPFVEFLKDCRMVYDYTNQRIIVYNTAVKYAYVFLLKSQQWGMIRSEITSGVNSYPEALAMWGTELVNFSLSDAAGITALAITRPFKIGDPNMFKTIDAIIQRGYFQRDHVAQVLYGSNDLFNWHTVWSSVDKYMRGFRGTPYKAFRLALICKLDKAESIFGFSVQLNPRLLNQPR